MNTLPTWISILQALLTPAIALAVGVIAFLQWRTAHQKVNLDLFDRRMAIYEGVIGRISFYFDDYDDDGHFTASQGLEMLEGKAKFLFGDEVASLIGELRREVWTHGDAYRKYTGNKLPPLETEHAKAVWESATDRLTAYEKRMTAAVLPYLWMDSKTVRTPTEWIAERNRIRLSYADEKQK